MFAGVGIGLVSENTDWPHSGVIEPTPGAREIYRPFYQAYRELHPATSTCSTGWPRSSAADRELAKTPVKGCATAWSAYGHPEEPEPHPERSPDMRTHRRVRAVGLLSIALAATTSGAPALATPTINPQVLPAEVPVSFKVRQGRQEQEEPLSVAEAGRQPGMATTPRSSRRAIDKAGRCSWRRGMPQV